MTGKELWGSILQKAMEGKLVPQRKEEGTAAELLKEIRKEKAKLVKEGKLKKTKPLPAVREEEKPFDIPDSWEWVRLGDIVLLISDGTHRTPHYTEDGIPFLSVKNVSSRKLDFSHTKFISCEEHEELCKRCRPEKGDILLSKVGTTGIPVYVNTDRPFSIFVSLALLKVPKCITVSYLIYGITAPLVQEQCKLHTRGVGNKNWVLNDIANTVMPLPPLAEQHRIVEKLEILKPLVDSYGQAAEKLDELNRKFPGDLKKSFLRQAMEGKLVPQRREEGTAAELLKEIRKEKAKLVKAGKLKKTKPLPAVSEEERPFDIPDSWEWVRLGDIGDWCSGATPSRQHPEYYGGDIPWLKTGDLNDGYISNISEYISQEGFEHSSVRLNPIGSVLIAMYGATIGKLGILQIPATTNQACCACILYSGVDNQYLFYFLLSHRSAFLKQGAGGAQPNISKAKIINTVMPLPPLAEQQRIVKKLESLLALCDKLQPED